MRVAIVHDWLNTKAGGAERVFADILSLYPKADVYTLLYNEHQFGEMTNGHSVTTSFLQRFPRAFRSRPQFLLPFIRRAITRWDFTGYDMIISSSGAWSKNVTVPKGTRHICYCHTPARMLWVDWPKYLDSFSSRLLKLPFAKLYVTRVVSRLRVWDFYQASSVDVFIANSRYVASRIKKFYRRESVVVYPGAVDTDHMPELREKDDYYAVVSTLAGYKNIDVVVEAFKQNGKQLKIAGEGSAQARLRELGTGSKNIEFLGFISEAEKTSLLAKARGFVFANIEDFGIAPVEALACGTPVIALAGGGVSESVGDQCGVFFDELSADAINDAINRAEKKVFKPELLQKRAREYSREQFLSRFAQLVDKEIAHGKK